MEHGDFEAKTFTTMLVPKHNRCNVATLVLGSQQKQRGYKVAEPKGSPGVKVKEVARVRAKKKPRSHVTYSWECKKV
jgi:hypothetical protein